VNVSPPQSTALALRQTSPRLPSSTKRPSWASTSTVSGEFTGPSRSPP